MGNCTRCLTQIWHLLSPHQSLKTVKKVTKKLMIMLLNLVAGIVVINFYTHHAGINPSLWLALCAYNHMQ